MLVMLVGIGFVAVLTATVASQFVKSDRSEETERVLRELDEIRAELRQLRASLEPHT
jgi:hypothetical protein